MTVVIAVLAAKFKVFNFLYGVGTHSEKYMSQDLSASPMLIHKTHLKSPQGFRIMSVKSGQNMRNETLSHPENDDLLWPSMGINRILITIVMVQSVSKR